MLNLVFVISIFQTDTDDGYFSSLNIFVSQHNGYKTKQIFPVQKTRTEPPLPKNQRA